MKKKVLFIGIGFYDYDQSIIEEFQRLGYDVDYYSEVPTGLKYRYHTRRNNTQKKSDIIHRTSMHIANSCSVDYDLVFVIKAEFLTQVAIDIIKQKNPNSFWILYLWDSIERIPESKSNFKNFDKIFSFDRIDCLSVEYLIFNPLFFRNEYNQKIKQIEEEEFGVYFLGWYHSDRLRLVKKIASFCKEKNIKYKAILYTGYIKYFIDIIMGGELKGNKEFLIFKSISAKINFNYILNAKSTLDIAHPSQSGLTMRTIELLGAQKKIITTNQDIVNYDFYHPNNILVINRENPILNEDFFKTDYLPISNQIREEYSIENWLKRML